MISLSVVILTYNEQKHIARCLKSLSEVASEIIVVDSFSTDNTVSIAKEYGARVYQNPWVNYAKQFNYGLTKVSGEFRWVMRMDSDEYLTDELIREINSSVDGLHEFNGFYIKRRVHFMERWIKNGDYYPVWLLRIWKNKEGVCEERWMDEHINLKNAVTSNLEYDLVDDNKNNLTWWTEKHNNYATREAIDLLNLQYSLFNVSDDVIPNVFGEQEERKRWLKMKYASLPLFLRPFLYFIYRYVIRLGFLDGRQGFIWHFLQGFWYRFLVDAKIYDIKRRSVKLEKGSIIDVIKNIYGVKNIDG